MVSAKKNGGEQSIRATLRFARRDVPGNMGPGDQRDDHRTTADSRHPEPGRAVFRSGLVQCLARTAFGNGKTLLSMGLPPPAKARGVSSAGPKPGIGYRTPRPALWVQPGMMRNAAEKHTGNLACKTRMRFIPLALPTPPTASSARTTPRPGPRFPPSLAKARSMRANTSLVACSLRHSRSPTMVMARRQRVCATLMRLRLSTNPMPLPSLLLT